MTVPIGRNRPCPCGSGKKYKKCCLPKEEAEADARRSVLTPEVLDAEDEGDSWLDDLDENDADDTLAGEGEWAVDVQAITRVCYTHGTVGSVAELRRGTGVSVVEWSAPDIPAAILESFELEEVAALDGVWGNARTGDPIQVDIVDVTTEKWQVTIEIFNRAITLLQFDSDEVRSIHRICETLRAVSAGGTEAVRPPAVAAGPTRRRVKPPDQPGVCDLCGQSVSFAEAGDHALACAPAHDRSAGGEKTLVQLVVTAPGLPPYWLRLEARSDAKLETLDRFLRDIWLECCGHLSLFRIGHAEYGSRGFDSGDDLGLVPRVRRRAVRKAMTVRLDSVLPSPGTTIEYEYDFGSTTRLQLRGTGERRGRPGRASVRLLVRNEPVAWTCGVCGAPATLVCPFCLGHPAGLVCKRHARRHPCDGDAESFLPVVNSPRMGVCGYTGA